MQSKNKELKQNLYINAAVTLVAQLLKLLIQFILQKVFIDTLGEVYLGYNSVFKNILQMLNMADLGVGVAITGFLYVPLAEGDDKRVSALMHIFKRVYYCIGGVVIVISGIVMLLLKQIIPDATCTIGYLRILFLINVMGTISSYFLAYKRTLLIANQKSYFTSFIDMISELAGSIIQIVSLFLIPSYIFYLVINVCKNIVSNIVISLECNKRYKNLIGVPPKEYVEEYKKPLFDYVKDIFVSRIGAYVFSGTDNIIISIFKGSLLAGYLSNYMLVSMGIKALITQILSAVQATFGHYVVTEKDKNKCLEMTDSYIYADYLIANVCMITCIEVFERLIPLYVGEKFLLGRRVAYLVSINLGLVILLIIPSQVFTVFKLFKHEKYISLVSAFLNIVISAALVVKIGVAGVLIGTTFTSLIYLFSRLFIMSKKIFEVSYFHYLKRIVLYGGYSIVSYLAIHSVAGYFETKSWLRLGIFAVSVACVCFFISIVLSCWQREYRVVITKIVGIKRKFVRLILAVVLTLGLIGFFSLICELGN